MAVSASFRTLCVFCGSRTGNGDLYRSAAAGFGRLIARSGLKLVYGGGQVGLMGAVADAALAEGGEVVGVMPQALIDREIGHKGLTRMHIVNSMHERKALMADLAEAFVALPGGHGTLDEFCEILTWAQLGIHAKPCGILNTAGYYNALLAMFDNAVEEGFLHAAHRDMIVVEEEPHHLLDRLGSTAAASVSKWDFPAPGAPVP